MSQAVRYQRRGSVGIITVDNPPVNALSQAVRQGLTDALAQGQGDAAPADALSAQAQADKQQRQKYAQRPQ